MIVRKVLRIPKRPKQARVFNASAGWRIVGEKRIYFRSRWEYIYAQYLQKLKEQGAIFDWQFEPETFWFESIKRGVRSYKPDFAVYLTPVERYWVEVKGYMDARSSTKIDRFKRFYPNEELRVVKKEWFTSRK
jgi:hypothetical protein